MNAITYKVVSTYEFHITLLTTSTQLYEESYWLTSLIWLFRFDVSIEPIVMSNLISQNQVWRYNSFNWILYEATYNLCPIVWRILLVNRLILISDLTLQMFQMNRLYVKSDCSELAGKPKTNSLYNWMLIQGYS